MMSDVSCMCSVMVGLLLLCWCGCVILAAMLLFVVVCCLVHVELLIHAFAVLIAFCSVCLLVLASQACGVLAESSSSSAAKNHVTSTFKQLARQQE